ncbi:SDR family oxidoreductase [Shewanella baltica]|uniref:oxidoreductase n=1 Tax=Shewanella baltica TaxID=62322 RepID=UPI00217E1297|nr:oxidoreductase [Shewanella baltica]MCS6118728.1 SDR family oxidoreductase [Shewanella baltica]
MLANKNILVVGASGLLGAKVVRSLLLHGSKVLAVDLDVKKLKSRLTEINVDVENPALSFSSLDVTSETAVKALLESLTTITGAVNCTYPRNKKYGAHFFDVNLSDFNENLSLHLGSSFLFMQQCAAYFKRVQSDFSLVNISSIYGVVAPKFDVYENTKMTMPVEYAAIKSALLHLSKYVVAYVADSRFRVNSVSPGGIFDHQPNDFLEAYKRQTLGKGMLDVDDVIGSIVYLLSDYARYVNGQNIVVDDGFVL